MRHAKTVWTEGVVPLWVYNEHDDDAPLEESFIYLGNETARASADPSSSTASTLPFLLPNLALAPTPRPRPAPDTTSSSHLLLQVREQQWRLLKFVEDSLNDRKFLVKVPPFGLTKIVQATSQNSKLESEVARLRFNLAVLGVAKVLAARGVYSYGYIAELEKGTNKVSRAFNGPKSIGELLDPIRKMMAAFHRILALSAPVHCLCLTTDDSTVSVEAKEVRPHAARTPPPLRASSSPYPCAIANASAFHPSPGGDPCHVLA